MHSKTTMRYHLKLKVIKKFTYNARWRGCTESGTLPHCWWDCKLVLPLWIHMEVTLKTKKGTTIWPSDPIPGYIHRENHNPKNCHIKWSKSDRKRQISYDIVYMWNLKQGTNELIYKIEHRCRKQIYSYQSERGGGSNWEIWADIYTLPYMKEITNKDLLYRWGKCTL